MGIRVWLSIAAVGGACSEPLSVSDAGADAGAPVLRNEAPIAAVEDTTARVGELAELSGRASADPEGQPLSFRWSLRSRPSGSAALLDANDGTTVVLVPDREGVFAVDLVVDDGELSSAATTAIVVVEGFAAPVAVAGPDRVVERGSLVLLDGSASVGPAERSLSFEWTLRDRPPESKASIVGPDRRRARLVPDALGELVVTLTVHDGVVRSVPDRVRIEVVERAAPDHEVALGRFDPARVYLLGDTGDSCETYAITDPHTPEVAVAGFDCYAVHEHAQLRPDGTLLYFNSTDALLREFQCDACPDWTLGRPIPADPVANDRVLPTPPCDPRLRTRRLAGFLSNPEGERIHACGPWYLEPREWFTEAGAPIARGITPIAFGLDGLLLLEGEGLLSLFDMHEGLDRPITGLPPSCVRRAARADPRGGFRVALACDLESSLWSIAADGSASLEGEFPPLEAGLRLEESAGELTGDGTLVELAYRAGGGDSEQLVIERDLEGRSEAVYVDGRFTPHVDPSGGSLVGGP
jgi:hypothetical protein